MSGSASPSDFVPVFPGWNVWTVWQVKDLSDLSPEFWGVSRDRRLRIWVEDWCRLRGVDVAGALDLKGSQIEILPSTPKDLAVLKRKEEIGGPALTVEGPAELRVVRFYSRGSSAVPIPWPHDDEYLVEAVYQPSASSPATSGPAPSTVVDGVTPSPETIEKISSASSKVLLVAALAAGGLLAVNLWAAARGR